MLEEAVPASALGGPGTVAVDGCCFVGSRTGIANYVAALLEPLCEQHRDVRFLLYCNDAGDFPTAPNLEPRISAPKRRGPIWHNTQVVDMLRDDGVDVFWGTNGLIPLRGLARTASVLTVHDLVHVFAPETQEAAKRWKQRFFQPRCVRAADRVMAVSKATAHDVARHYGRMPDAVIHPLAGDSFSLADRAAAEHTLQRLRLPRKFILTVGTLEPRKNVKALMEAHASCLADGLDLPPLVVVGGQGWRDAEVRASIDQATASGWVRYLGYVPAADLSHLYSACHALVMPSLYEGFGMPLLEAQMCGAAVVHGDHASMREAAGGLGVAFEPSATGLRKMLAALARNELPFACRLASAIENNAAQSARRFWDMVEQAWRAKHRPASRG
ncbi:MAG TPA: glycosyltransferase family 1 protein [Caldimonas sp.]|nr:glycosyltransferase family 1 protein [Caldimonas sp.]HEX2541260.1 glycosyltransferase family 1 protein [Caldimonas sp.]